jgi:hypothetical protein
VLLERMRTTVTHRATAGLAVATGLTLLSGYPPMFAYVGLVAGAYALLRGWQAPCGRGRYYGAASLAAVLGLALAAVQLVPTLATFGEQVGGAWTLGQFNDGAYRPSDYLRLLFPFVTGGARAYYDERYFGEPARILVYLGIAPLMLGAIGMVNQRIVAVPRAFWLCAAGYVLALVLGPLTPVATLTHLVPLLNVGHEWARLFPVVALALAVFAAAGTSTILSQAATRRIAAPVLAVTSLAMLALGMLQVAPERIVPFGRDAVRPEGWSFSPLDNPAFAVPLGLVVVSALVVWLSQRGAKGRQLGQMVVPAVVFIDLLSFGYAHDWRQLSVEASELTSRPASLERLRTSLRASNQRVASYRGADEDGTLVAERRHPDDRAGLRQEINRFWGFETLEYFGKWRTPEFDALTDRFEATTIAGGSPALDVLGVRTLLVYSPRDPDRVELPSPSPLAQALLAHPDAWRDLGQASQSRVFENLHARPRAWVAAEALVVGDEDARAILRSGRRPNGDTFDPARTVLVAAPGMARPPAPTATATSVAVVARAAQRMSVRVQTDQPGTLVVSDIYHPAWHATVNGASTPIRRAYLVLRAIDVPAGESLVEMRFVPWDFYVGLGVTSAALLACLALLWPRRASELATLGDTSSG